MRNRCVKVFLALVFAAMAAVAREHKDIILFIGDGMALSQRVAAEEFSRKFGLGPLAMNTMPVHSATRTASLSSLVTDSAASGTAIACGEKTLNGAVGVDKDGKRLESCAEAAKKAGMRVGIMTTVTINHATPACFYAHRKHRSELYGIGLDLLESGFDLFMGGGLAGASDKTGAPGYIGNIYEVAASKGWLVLEGAEGFEEMKDKEGLAPVWWRNGEQAMPYAIDAGNASPRLPEMVEFAIERLHNMDTDSPGFFLMVEGGRIDWAGHANEAAENVRDVLELDAAVKVALDFQMDHPETLVIVTGDHETGGMSLGSSATGYAFYPERLAAQTCSCDTFKARYHAMKDAGCKFDDVKKLLAECYGFKFEGDIDKDPMVLTDKEVDSLKRHFKEGGLSDKARRIMQERAGVGWTSGSHTGVPVLTTSSGPGSERLSGFIENSDIATVIKDIIGGR